MSRRDRRQTLQSLLQSHHHAVVPVADAAFSYGLAGKHTLVSDDNLLQQIVIGHKSVFAGKTIAESGIRNRYNCMVVGLEKGLESLSPVTPTHRLNGGDIIWIVGEKDDIETIVQQL